MHLNVWRETKEKTIRERLVNSSGNRYLQQKGVLCSFCTAQISLEFLDGATEALGGVTGGCAFLVRHVANSSAETNAGLDRDSNSNRRNCLLVLRSSPAMTGLHRREKNDK